MLILGQRNDDSLGRDFDWFGSSERSEISPASIWVLDEEETIRRRRVTPPQPAVVEENFDDYWSLHEISPQIGMYDEDSFANPRALPEINPQVSVRDEDSFAKPIPLPEINPHVSVRDEDSFAKPRPLPAINPHVSVRDEDSFAKPRPLPEIDPHVSVRDEDSFAEPKALPEIHPHVSIRDEDSFAKPRALPEICPQISFLDESQAGDLSSQFTSGACGIDDSKTQPGEPSFVTVTLDGQNKKKFIQEYMELAPPTRPIEFGSTRPNGLEPSRPAELESNRSPESGSSRPTGLELSRPIKLEPSRPAKLESSQPPELEATRPAELEASRPPELETSRPAVSAQVRVLDESQVLPGEASFATAIPEGPSAPRIHSPLEEFLAKTNMDLRTFMLASLLFVSIIGISALVIMEATTGIFSSKLVASATASAPSANADASTPQSQVQPSTKPVAPIAMSKLPKQESQSMAAPREYPKFPEEGTKSPSLGPISEISRKAHSNDVRAEKSDRQSASNSHETSNRQAEKHAAFTKNLRTNLKDGAARKTTAESVSRRSNSSQKRSETNKSRAKTTASKPASVFAKNATITKPKAETKVPSGVNGAQRPRTVTPRKTSLGQ